MADWIAWSEERYSRTRVFRCVSDEVAALKYAAKHAGDWPLIVYVLENDIIAESMGCDTRYVVDRGDDGELFANVERVGS